MPDGVPASSITPRRGRQIADAALTHSKETARSIARLLGELGIATTHDEVRELTSAYPALEAWMRMAEELDESDGILPAEPEPA